MNKKLYIYGSIIILVIIIIYFLFIRSHKQPEKFTFDTIKRENIVNTITSTGTLGAITQVDVGTQISGKIKKLYVDYNSHVKRGQILAVIDTVPLAIQVSNARAVLLKAQSQYNQAKILYNNNKILYEKKLVANTDYISTLTTLESDSADVQSAKGALEQAKTNLGYAYIYSPINGVVINKNVLEGQTVAASLQTPVLFSIAQDLSKMQILASVDESDIGQIKLGQKADFTVEAFPDKKFYGNVTQIRLNSQVVSNVVEYTVVVNADNNENTLLPGMTATLDFIIQEKDDALAIPNSALKFQPTQQMLDEIKETMQNKMQELPDSIKNKLRSLRNNFNQNRGSGQSQGNFSQGAGNGITGRGPGNAGGNPSSTGFAQQGGFQKQHPNITRVWFLDNNGKLDFEAALLGITDGKNTEILWSSGLHEGMQIITGIVNNNAVPNGNSAPNRQVSPALRRGF